MFSAGVWGTVSDWLLVVLAVGTVTAAWLQIKKAGDAVGTQIKASSDENLRQIKAAAEISRAEIAASIENNVEQLKVAAEASRNQAEIARATLLLEIDRDFESADMQESRMALRGLRNEIEALCADRYKTRNDSQREAKCHDLFSEYLNKLWRDFKKADKVPDVPQHFSDSNALDDMKNKHVEQIYQHSEEIQPHEKAGAHYQRLMRLPGWLERVGHMANQGLIPEVDVIKLYDVLFLKMGSLFAGHIEFRRNEGNDDFMKEFMTFSEKIEELRSQNIATRAAAGKVADASNKAKVFEPKN